MNKDVKEYVDILKSSKKQFVILFIIMLAFFFIPMNIWTLNLVVLLVLFGAKIYSSYFEDEVIFFRDLPWWAAKVVLAVSLFYFGLRFLKGYGWWGLLAIVLLLAAYKVYLGRDLFFKTAEIVGKNIREARKK